MSSDLERRLEGLLAEAPEPDPGAGEKALHRALRALQPAAPSRRGIRTVVVAFAAVLVLLAIAAGSLAAAGGLHVSFGTKTTKPPAHIPLSLPKGADGIAVIVDGRLSVITHSGFRLQGLPVSAATLSPHALYVAAGIGHSLVAMKPNKHQAWSHPAGGRVTAIAWAPDGLRIAYLVWHQHSRFPWTVHVIWGNGTHDEVVGRSVNPVRPSWRADSLAVAYVGTDFQPTIYDVAHASHHVVRIHKLFGGVARMAFAPTGDVLAVDTGRRTILVGKNRKIVWRGNTEGIGWLNGRLAVAAATPGIPRHVYAFSTHGKMLALVTADGRTARVLAGQAGHLRTVFAVPEQPVTDVELG
jgi:hypothetical protein